MTSLLVQVITCAIIIQAGISGNDFTEETVTTEARAELSQGMLQFSAGHGTKKKPDLDDDDEDEIDNEYVHMIVNLAVDEASLAVDNVIGQMKSVNQLIKRQLPDSIDSEDETKKSTKLLMKHIRKKSKLVCKELKTTIKNLKSKIDKGISEAQNHEHK